MLSQFYWPIIGGEERVVQDLSRELASRGHSVAVATQWHAGLPEFELDGTVRVYRLRSLVARATWLFRESGRRHAPPWPDLGTTLGLRQVIRRERPRIVHAHNWLVYSFLPLKNMSGARLVVTLHDYSLLCAKKRLMFEGRPCSGPRLSKCLACASQHYGLVKGPATVVATGLSGQWERAAVDLFLPISQAVAEKNQLDHGKSPYEVIPNFAPAASPAAPAELAPYVAQLPVGEFLLFVGDLSLDKGLGVLLQAYAALTQPPPLVLIGRRVADTPAVLPANVQHLGAWPHAAILDAWRRCRLGLIPSVWPEPFGLVALEAMSAGRPVIASNTGGLSDIVTDGESGLLVPPGDVGALRNAIQRLLQDAVLSQRLGCAAKQRAAEYDAAVVVPRVEQAYRRLTHLQYADAD